MNINLGETLYEARETPGDFEPVYLQGEIDEHREIMAKAGVETTEQVMLLSDPEYPGAYRVWLQLPPARPDLDARYRGAQPAWVWVTPDGQVVNSTRPWGVTA